MEFETEAPMEYLQTISKQGLITAFSVTEIPDLKSFGISGGAMGFTPGISGNIVPCAELNQ